MATRDVQIYFKVDGLEQYITSLEELDQVLKQVNGSTDQVASTQQKLEDATNDILSSSEKFEQRLNTMEGATKLLAGSFEALAGAASLAGLEDNEFFKELSDNVVGVLALSRGAIDAAEGVRLLAQNQKLATAAQAAFNFVANLNPYVLLATAIIAAGAALIAFTSDSEEAEEQAKDLNAELEKQIARFDAYNARIDDEINARRRLVQAKNGEVKLDQEIGFIKEKIALRQEDIVALEAEQYKILSQGVTEAEKERLTDVKEALQARRDQIDVLNTEIQIVTAEDARRRQEKANAEAAQRRADQARLEAEISLKLITDERERELEIIRRKYEEEIKLAEGNANLIKMINEQLQKDINETNARYALERIDPIKPLQQDIDETRELITSTNNVVAQSSTEVADAWGLSYRKAFDAYVEEPGRASDLLRRDTKATLDFVNNLNTIFTKDNDKRAKRAFDIAKALSLSTAVINTAEGITKALTDPTQPSTLLRILQTAAVAAAGAAQIATISRQQYGGNAEKPAPPSPGGALATPQINYNFAQNSGQVLTPGGVESEPVRAYVLVSDVNSAQQANNQIERYSRL